VSRPAVDRRRPPPPGVRRPFRFPPFAHRRLANGLDLWVAPFPHLPLVDLEIVVDAGGQHAPRHRPGLPSLHGALLSEGTESLTAPQIAQRMERLGGTLSSGVDWNVAGASASALAVHLEAAFELLVEVVRRPSFPAQEVERLRRQRLAELLRQRDQPRALAERHFARTVYGDAPYGFPLLGSEAALQAIERPEIVDFYRRHVHPGGAALVATGDVDPERLMALAEAALADWPAAEPAGEPAIEPLVLEHNKVVLVDRPEAAQTQLKMGHASVPRRHPGYPVRVLLNAILGGSFISRLNLNLRERHGITYGVRSSFVRRRGPGPFQIDSALATEAAGKAVREILAEVERIRQEPVSAAELDGARGFMIDVFPYTVQTLNDVSQRLEDLSVYRLGDDYYEHFPAQLADVSAAQIRDAAQRLLHPQRMAIVAVGPAAQLAPQLEPFGPLEIVSP